MAQNDQDWNRWFSPDVFLRNYRALERMDPGQARRIRATPLDRPDILPQLLPSGLPSAEIIHLKRVLPLHHGPDPYLEAAEDLRAGLERAASSLSPALALIGLGLGYHLELLLAQTRAGDLRVFEPDPLWLYLTLSRIDVSDALESGRLRLLDGMGALELADGLPPGAALIVHRGLEPRLRWEVETVRRTLERRWGSERASPDVSENKAGLEAGGVDASPDVSENKAGLEAGGVDASPHSEPLSSGYRVCLVDGELFFEDLAEAFTRRGDALLIFHPARLSAGEILEELDRVRPDLVLSVNQVEGLAELCAAAGIPYVVWEIDPRMWVVQPPTPEARPWIHTFTYRQRHVARYLEAGFLHVDHLPLAATPAFRHPLALTPEDQARYAAPISFVGSSLMLDNLRDQQRAEKAIVERLQACRTPGETERWHRALAVLRDALQAQQADLMRPILIEQLEAGWAALGLTPELEVEGRLLDLRIVYARLFGTHRRALVIGSLAEFGVAVYGDAAWPQVLGPEIAYRGAADHSIELTSIYNASEINLDIGRLYQLDIVTMRVFDILASGGFPLVEYSEELPALLESGREVVSYRSLDEAKQAAAFYLAHPRERQDVVAVGRARVLQDHTVARRVETILTRLRARGALRGDGQRPT